jgi:hypothetical protein
MLFDQTRYWLLLQQMVVLTCYLCIAFWEHVVLIKLVGNGRIGVSDDKGNGKSHKTRPQRCILVLESRCKMKRVAAT